VEVYRLEKIVAQEPPGGAGAALRGWRKITQAGRLEAVRDAAGGQGGKEKDGGRKNA
jgi:hypothetical protein